MSSQSFSKSYSSSTGPDGVVHQKSSKQGSKMQCHNGQCTKTVCENGKCHQVQFKEDPEKLMNNMPRMPKMPKLFDDFEFPKIEMPDFSESFRNMESSMQRMREKMNSDFASVKGGDMKSESFSSSYSSSTDQNGETHEHSNKEGVKKTCHNGQCKIVTCNNGRCTEKVVGQ